MSDKPNYQIVDDQGNVQLSTRAALRPEDLQDDQTVWRLDAGRGLVKVTRIEE